MPAPKHSEDAAKSSLSIPKRMFAQAIAPLMTASEQTQVEDAILSILDAFDSVDRNGDEFTELVEHSAMTLIKARPQIIKGLTQQESVRADAAERQQQIQLDKVIALSYENQKLLDELRCYQNRIAELEQQEQALGGRSLSQANTAPARLDTLHQAHSSKVDTIYESTSSVEAEQMISVGSSRTSTMPGSQHNVYAPRRQILAASRVPDMPVFYGRCDDNRRQIDEPNWDAWHERFELYFGSEDSTQKLLQLKVLLGGEAATFRSTMLDPDTAESYDKLVAALARRYTVNKTPVEALCDFQELKQHHCDIRMFEQKFQAAYAQAAKLNPGARLTEVQLRTQFVGKVRRELHDVLHMRCPDYHQTMPLHEITNTLADIEKTMYPHLYRAQMSGTNAQYREPRQYWRGPGRGGYQQRRFPYPSSQHPQIRTPCDICGDRAHNAQECRAGAGRTSHTPGNIRGRGRGNGQNRGPGREKRAEEITVEPQPEGSEEYGDCFFDAYTFQLDSVGTVKIVDGVEEPLPEQRNALSRSLRCRAVFNSSVDRWASAFSSKPAVVKLCINGTKLDVLIDTGAQANIIPQAILGKLVPAHERWRASAHMATDVSRYPTGDKPTLRSATGGIIPTIALIDVTCGDEPELECPRITLAVTNRQLPRIVLGIPALSAIGATVRLPGLGNIMPNFARPPTARLNQNMPKNVQTQTAATIPSRAAAWGMAPNEEAKYEALENIAINSTYTDPLVEQKPLAHMIVQKTFTLPPGGRIRVPTKIRFINEPPNNATSLYVESHYSPNAYLCVSWKSAKRLCILQNDTDSPITIVKGDIVAKIDAYDNDEEQLFYQLTAESARKIEQSSVMTEKQLIIGSFESQDPRWNERLEFISANLSFGSAFTSEQKEQVEALVKQYADLVCLDSADLPPCEAPPFRIETGSARPFKEKPRPVPPAARECLTEEIQKMLRGGVIERVIDSPYSSPVVVVPKRGTNRWRMAVDLRKLNSQTEFAVARLPSVQELIYGIKDKPYISTFDCQSAFWQIPLEEKDRNKTTFTIAGPAPLGGTYRFLRMPFGALNAAQHYQHAIEAMMRPVAVCDDTKLCQAYLDDLIVASSTFDEHIELLQRLFRCLRENRCKLNLPKSVLGAEEVSYLGYIVNSSHYKPQPERIAPIFDIQAPTNLTEVRSFIGKLLYYQRGLPDLQRTLEPLHQLLRGTKQKNKRNVKGKFRWGEQHQHAFEKARKLLAEATTLYHPDIRKPFELLCDACDYGVGAALVQEDAQGIKRPIAFMSKLLTRTQRNYSVTEKELLAVLLGLEANRQWLACAQVDITTDHAPLVSLLKSSKETSPRLERWRSRLEYFTIRKVKYIPGPLNLSADCLSRLNHGAPPPPDDDNDAASDVGLPDSFREMPNVIAITDDTAGKNEANEPDEEWYELVAPSHNRLYKAQCIDEECSTLYQLVSEAKRLEDAKNERQTKKECMRTTKRSKRTDVDMEESTTPPLKTKAADYLRSYARVCDIVDDYLVVISPITEAYVPVIPQTMRREVIRMAHEAPSSGHIRMPKLYRLLLAKCSWPRMHRDIKHYLRSCVTCTSVNPGIAFKPDWHFIVPTEPMQVMHIDVAKFAAHDPMYGLVAVDAFTRKIWTLPMQTQDATTQIITLTQHVIAEHGFPQAIITDAHPAYMGEEWRSWCELNGIDHRPGRGYSSTHNSLAERAIATVRNELRKSCIDPREWTSALPLLLLAYNSAPHTTTGFSPHFLMHLREPKIKLDSVLAAPKRLRVNDAPSYALQQATLLAKAYKSCRENITQNRTMAAKQYAKNHGKNVPTKINIGDMVLRRSAHERIRSKNWKMDRAFGPYKVLEIKEAHAKVATLTGEIISDPVHISNLIPLRDKAFVPCYISENTNTPNSHFPAGVNHKNEQIGAQEDLRMSQIEQNAEKSTTDEDTTNSPPTQQAPQNMPKTQNNDARIKQQKKRGGRRVQQHRQAAERRYQQERANLIEAYARGTAQGTAIIERALRQQRRFIVNKPRQQLNKHRRDRQSEALTTNKAHSNEEEPQQPGTSKQ